MLESGEGGLVSWVPTPVLDKLGWCCIPKIAAFGKKKQTWIRTALESMFMAAWESCHHKK